MHSKGYVAPFMKSIGYVGLKEHLLMNLSSKRFTNVLCTNYAVNKHVLLLLHS